MARRLHNVGALMIRIGFFWVFNVTIVLDTPKPYSNYSGPYIKQSFLARFNLQRKLRA